MSGAAGRLGAVDGAALVVASVVGAGIFTVPSYVARVAGTPGLTLALWLAGGLLAMAGALCYAELATRFARGGAEYVYLREAFGETVGFLSGWTSFVAGFSGAIAAAAVGFATHLAAWVPAMRALPRGSLALGPITLTIDPTTLVAAALVTTFTALALAGAGVSRVATNALALVVIAGIAAVTLAGAVGGAGRFATGAAMSGAGAAAALVPIYFTFSGWNAAAYVAGEFRDPRRTIPRALVGGTLLVTLLYVGLNAALLRALPIATLSSSGTPVADGAASTLGEVGGIVVALVVLAALASSVCALVVTGPRIYQEMARDGALPPLFASSRRRGTPAAAAIAQSAWSTVLVLTGTFEQVVTCTGFSILLFSGMAVCALLVLRRRDGEPRGYAVPGYPLVPLLFVAAVIAIAVASVRHAPGPSLVGVALIGAGVPVRRLMRKSSGDARIAGRALRITSS